MSKLEKAIQRLKSIPRDYTYAEAKYLLGQFSFIELNKGKTSGSRVMFYRPYDKARIFLHKPHPKDIMSVASVKDIIRSLREIGEID